MDFNKVCSSRFSVRKFLDKKVEDDKIESLLELARIAPTAKNSQPYFIYVVKSNEGVAKLRSIAKCAFDAPQVFLICADVNKSWVNPFSKEASILQDIGIITTTLMYGVTELGLGSTYVCYYDPKLVKEQFNIPEHLEVKAMLPFGYYDNSVEPAPMHFEKRQLTEIYKEI